MNVTDEQTERLGRFGHHPDPAIDFYIEVECLDNEIHNRLTGFLNGTPSMAELRERLERAMEFRVGGDEIAVAAKQTLRKVDARIRSALASPAQGAPPSPSEEDDLVAALKVATDALEGLSYIHDGNPSDAMADTPPLEYARHMLYEARRIAKEAVREVIAIRNARKGAA